MEGVVSLLSEEFDTRVRAIWKTLEEEFGLRGVYRTPYPHFSYIVAEHFDRTPLTAVLRDLAADLEPFAIKTTGLASFDVAEPVLFIAVELAPELRMLQETVWQAAQRLSAGALGYYEPSVWVPHITLAVHDLKDHQIASIRTWLRDEPLNWELQVDCFATILERNGIQDMYDRIPFGG